MTTKRQIILTAITTVYLLTVFFTDISLVGYWTDIVFSILIVSVTLKLVFKSKTEKTWLTWTLRSLAILTSIVVYGLLVLNLINPFAWDTFKMRSFYYQSVDERLFNAYFKPVGAYSGGEGNFWITETYKYFPIIEEEKYYEHAILWNFRHSEFDGQAVNQEEIVKAYVRDEILEREK